MKTYYELLSVRSDAPPGEIKRAFRREIARYHPDKVQHLGPEFQELAALRAAELTEAYRVLMDGPARGLYDEQLKSAVVAPPPTPAAPAQAEPAGPHEEAAPPPPPPSAFEPIEPVAGGRADVHEREVGDEFVRRVSLRRVREAIGAALGPTDPLDMHGFDVSCQLKARRGLFKKPEAELRVLARYVPHVDGAAVNEAWPIAVRAAAGHAHVCVFLMGAGLAPRAELAEAIAEQRRQSRGRAALVFVPLDVRDWEAFVPTDAPAAVRAILSALRGAS